ncbi:hypothetical protein TPHA_0B04780 [Tetrapisispora phaffii CBS 4417]|uniref:SH3 domain-containing protein n=1 Tax=Tetrapisispora phaffii (strain ATCC 24235 / CBS 4417 / NBRC 1672 / NRRL Y-8282 / UCD 70-5) TaxID=1071381 RepID=G8BQ66_TETPH|nr:hypothetical protein TPHA_0B04780 [Tetrapisispora phaffii CBS 4417]CCE62147.1 hypothetical protein TPHA_0B04780 [Tetrapisispora phaffii CBS 4417]
MVSLLSLKVPNTIVNSDTGLNSVTAIDTSSSSNQIGLIIGLPVGFVCFCIILILIYFYMRKYNYSIAKDTSPKSRSKNWLTEKIYTQDYRSDYLKKNSDDIINKQNLPFGQNVSSHIEYKILNPLHKHILTPKNAVQSNIYKNSNVGCELQQYSDEAEKLLYTSPPNIYHISSTFPSIGKDEEANIDFYNNDSPRSNNWKYDSPLSKWFMRSSLYLRDFGTNVKCSDMKLKKLKLLSHIEKKHVDIGNVDERSPILASAVEKYNSGAMFELNYSDEDEGETKGDTNINQQILYPDNSGTLIFKIDPVPSSKKCKNKHKGNKKKNNKKKYKSHLKYLRYLSQLKPLPLTPTSRFIVGKVFGVKIKYEAKLTDEINIDCGEHVRVLAVHSDGWCLVEKCQLNGSSLCNTIDEPRNIDSKLYLNDERGIIPGYCLDG